MHNDSTIKHIVDVHLHEPLQINLCITQAPGGSSDSAILAEILRLITQQTQTLKELKMTDQEVKTLLTQVDVTTNKTASNLALVAAKQVEMADTQQEISDDLDRLIAGATGLSPDTARQLQAIADRLQVTSDQGDAVATVTTQQADFLKTIAAKSSPVIPPPPPEPVI